MKTQKKKQQPASSSRKETVKSNPLKKTFQKNILPHILIIISFVVIGYLYFYPLLEGKDLPQMDNTHASGMAQELVEFEQQYPDEESQWTNSAFGGMPAYQIKGGKSNNLFLHLHRFLRFNLPYTTVAIIFIYLLCFYILMISLGYNYWLSFIGSVAFAFVTYNLDILITGHTSKTYAIAYMAPVIAGIILTYNKKYILGGIITMLGLGLEIASNHIQITYYLLLTVVIIGIVELVYSIREKQMKHFGIATATLLVAALLGVIPNLAKLWTTYEYGKYTTRGETILTSQKEKNKSEDGLDKDYALGWSLGIPETFSLMIPNARGGHTGRIGEVPEAMEKVDANFKEAVKEQNRYWGNQPFTGAPYYVGAIITFLFILGLFLVKGRLKWWVLIATILSILLAWGKNFPPITDFFFHHVPFYNKFRTVTMSLVIAGLTMPLLAIAALKKIIDDPNIIRNQLKKFFIAFGLTGGLCLLFLIIPHVFFNFITAEEQAYFNKFKSNPEYAEFINGLIPNIEDARITIFRADVLRSFAFITLAAGIVLLFAYGKLKRNIMIGSVLFLVAIDLIVVDQRYVNSDHFVRKRQIKQQFEPTAADQFILKDKDPHYRVVNIARNPFTEVHTSYFHKSLGGYHGAKLRRYQDIIEHYLAPDIQALRTALQKEKEGDQNQKPDIYKILDRLNVINMLNTKYIIYNPQTMPLINMKALGNAWFVNEYEIVENADKEMEALEFFNPKTTAIVHKEFEPEIKQLPKTEFFSLDSSEIRLTQYKANHLIYEAKTPKKKLAVFSEIYYPKGWQAYIDGKPTRHIRVNYILRALPVPAGSHKIEFKFEPKSYITGQKIALASSLIIGLLILGGIAKLINEELKKIKGKQIKKKNKNKEN